MKKYNSFLFVLVAVFTLVTFSCKRDIELPPPLKFDGEATHTIAELLSMRTDAPYDSLPKTMIIKGKVISSDKEGNCYKFLVIQDKTGGIQIQINNSSLYYKYAVGQTVYVKCKDLVLSEYYGLYQLSWLYETGLERLPSSKEAAVIFRDSLVGNAPAPKVIREVSDIQPSMYNTLVKLENCQFQKPATTYYDYGLGYSTTSCNLLLNDGTVIAARISQYATFAKSLTPGGKGNVTGILTVYKRNNGTVDNQLIIRSLDDVQNFVPPVTEQTIITTDMTANPFHNGWSQKSIVGTKSWEYDNSNHHLVIIGDGNANQNWLISPAYPQLNQYKNVKLLLNHRVPNSMGNNTNMRVYYTTTAQSGAFNEADWTLIPTESNFYPSGGGEFALNIPEQAASSPNFRIAWQYNDDRTSRWYLYGVSFKGISK